MLKFMGEHPISIVLVGVTLPGALAALAEYAITSGVSGTASVYSAVFGGVVTTVVLFSLKKLAASRPSQLVQQSQPERTPGPPTRPKAVESSPSQRSPVHPIDGRVFSPRTPAELVAEIEGKTTLVAGRIRTNVPTAGYNIQSLFHILPQHTVALKCAKSLELPQNGFLRGNQR